MLVKLREVLAAFPPDAVQALMAKPLAEVRPLRQTDRQEEAKSLQSLVSLHERSSDLASEDGTFCHRIFS